MTAGDLIRELSKLDPRATVYIEDDYGETYPALSFSSPQKESAVISAMDEPLPPLSR